MSPEASYYSPLWGPVANVEAHLDAAVATCCSTPAFPGTTSRGRSTTSRDLAADALPRVDIARSTLDGRAAARDAARQPGAADLERASLSWLPRWRGEHQVRTGVQFQLAPYGQTFDSLGHGDLVARYRNGVPDSVTVYNTPVATSLEQTELGLFVQDSWTIAGRLTLNAGVRFERHVGSLNAAVGGGG